MDRDASTFSMPFAIVLAALFAYAASSIYDVTFDPTGGAPADVSAPPFERDELDGKRRRSALERDRRFSAARLIAVATIARNRRFSAPAHLVMKNAEELDWAEPRHYFRCRTRSVPRK